jgi:hypothetical protein
VRGSWIVVAALAAGACGDHAAPATPPAVGSAAPHPVDAAVLADLPPLALGLPALDGYAWRKRAGQAAFRVARKAEDHEDWKRVVTACREALSADPGHLEAAWLLAVADAKLGGSSTEILGALTTAVAGDFGKWGPPSLEQPALQAFLATDAGKQWRHRVELDQPRYAEALARALVVTSAGDLYAYDPQQPRWYRLTRTYGAVVGALAVPDARSIYYVTSRSKLLQVGVVDLARGHSSRPQELGSAGPIAVSRGWISTPNAGHAGALRSLDDDGFLHPVAPRTPRPVGPWLEVSGRSARVHRLPLDGITADWDDRGLASAMRLAASNRVVSVPTGQIDGDTVVWSPDQGHLALVAVLDEHCTPGAPAAAAFIVDAATGALHEIRRANGGLAVAWLGDGKLALSGDNGIELLDPAMGSGSGTLVAATGDLLARKRRARCTPDDAPPEPDEPDEPAVEP